MDGEKISNKTTIRREINNNNGIIWIRTTSHQDGKTDLDHFSSMLNEIKNPVIFITSDGDRSVSSSYDKLVVSKLLKSPKITALIWIPKGQLEIFLWVFVSVSKSSAVCCKTLN